jgi:hypothetical protein
MERSIIGLLLAKAEATYATDPTPTGSANTIAVRRNSVKFGPKFTHIQRSIQDGSIGDVLGVNALPEVDFSFQVELRGNRTDGTTADISAGSSAHALEIDCLLQACDLSPTYTAETTSGARNGKVVYSPIVPTDQGKSVTFYFYSGLKLHKITGAKGTVKISALAGQFGILDFSFKGLYNAPTDVAISTVTPTFLNTLPPTFINTGSTVDSFSPVFTKFDFDLGAKVDKREDGNSVNGVAGFIITDRKPKVTIDPESVAEGTDPIWGDLYAATKRTITAKIGSQTGNQVQMTFVAVSDTVSYGDRSGIRTQNIGYSVERQNISDTPGAEIQLQFS